MIDVRITIDEGDDVLSPCSRIAATRAFIQSLTELADEGPTEGVLVLLSTAALIAKECAMPGLTRAQRIRALAQGLGHAVDAVEGMVMDDEGQEIEGEAVP